MGGTRGARGGWRVGRRWQEAARRRRPPLEWVERVVDAALEEQQQQQQMQMQTQMQMQQQAAEGVAGGMGAEEGL